MRPFLALVGGLLALSCGRPIAAVPTSAGPSRGLSICWVKTDATYTGTRRALHEAIKTRLEGAGYLLVERACDLRLWWNWYSRNDTTFEAFLAVDLKVQNGSGDLIDKIRLEYGATEVPVSEPDRLAILMVNAINASSKVAAVARARSLEPISISKTGIVVRSDPDGNARVDILKARALFGPTDHIDVTLEPEAKMETVNLLLSDLADVGLFFIRVHGPGLPEDRAIEVEIMPPRTWAGRGTWVGVSHWGSDIAVVWRTDRECANTPRSVRAPGAWIDIVKPAFSACRERGCFSRLVLNTARIDEFLGLLATAKDALHAAVPLDLRSPARFDPKCHSAGMLPPEEVDILMRNRVPTIQRCAPTYHGDIKVTLSFALDGSLKSSSLDFDQPGIESAEGPGSDRRKTCIMSALPELRGDPLTTWTHTINIP